MTDSIYSESLYGAVESLLEVWLEIECVSEGEVLRRAERLVADRVKALGSQIEQEQRIALEWHANELGWSILSDAIKTVFADRNRNRETGLTLAKQIREASWRIEAHAPGLGARAKSSLWCSSYTAAYRREGSRHIVGSGLTTSETAG